MFERTRRHVLAWLAGEPKGSPQIRAENASPDIREGPNVVQPSTGVPTTPTAGFEKSTRTGVTMY